MELVLDRPSNETDTVVFDFDGTCNGEKIQGGSAKSYTLDLAHSNFIPGFAEQLVGHNIKDEFDIQVTFPADYHDEKLKGQPATFAIKMNEIKQRVLPELTDEFVKKSSRFSTVAFAHILKRIKSECTLPPLHITLLRLRSLSIRAYSDILTELSAAMR